MNGLIQDLDPLAYDNLQDPSPLSDTGKNPIADADFNERIRTLIADAAIMVSDTGIPSNNALMKRMEDYYRNQQFDAKNSAAAAEYAQFMTKYYPDSWAGQIPIGVKFSALSLDQLVYFGLFLANKRELKFN